MKGENNKQFQRKLIDEAVKDFLSRGGTIKKIDLKTYDDGKEFRTRNDDPDDLLESYPPETSHFVSIKKHDDFGD